MIKLNDIDFCNISRDGKRYLRGRLDGISLDVEMVETEFPIGNKIRIDLAKDFLRDALDSRLNVLKMAPIE